MTTLPLAQLGAVVDRNRLGPGVAAFLAGHAQEPPAATHEQVELAALDAPADIVRHHASVMDKPTPRRSARHLPAFEQGHVEQRAELHHLGIDRHRAERLELTPCTTGPPLRGGDLEARGIAASLRAGLVFTATGTPDVEDAAVLQLASALQRDLRSKLTRHLGDWLARRVEQLHLIRRDDRCELGIGFIDMNVVVGRHGDRLLLGSGDLFFGDHVVEGDREVADRFRGLLFGDRLLDHAHDLGRHRLGNHGRIRRIGLAGSRHRERCDPLDTSDDSSEQIGEIRDRVVRRVDREADDGAGFVIASLRHNARPGPHRVHRV